MICICTASQFHAIISNYAFMSYVHWEVWGQILGAITYTYNTCTYMYYTHAVKSLGHTNIEHSMNIGVCIDLGVNISVKNKYMLETRTLTLTFFFLYLINKKMS